MGCMGSKESGLGHVDDSVHVMIAHDKKVAKKKGQQAPTGYVPRADPPLLPANQQAAAAQEEDDGAAEKALEGAAKEVKA